jgi:hypothetical protein
LEQAKKRRDHAYGLATVTEFNNVEINDAAMQVTTLTKVTTDVGGILCLIVIQVEFLDFVFSPLTSLVTAMSIW